MPWWEGGCACEQVRTEGEPDCGGLVCRAISTFPESSGWAGKASPSMSPQGLLHPSPVLNLDGSTLGQGSRQVLLGISATQCQTRH